MSELRVVLCWHMHQPSYRDPLTGQSREPWTYLHAIKDYVDMAAHLEAHPRVQAVVNFSATLLDQLQVYSDELERLERGEGVARDSLLAALYGVGLPDDRADRAALVRCCLRAHPERMIDRFPAFRLLADAAHWALEHPHALDYFKDEYLADLVVWYHLAWLGETVRRNDPVAQRLVARERHYTLRDRADLIGLIRRLVSSLIPRYRALADRGQVELSVTPYSHPILPLLLGFDCAREAWPQCPLPVSDGYPGGQARVRWQLARARERFALHFGVEPQGCWPSEGGVSTDLLPLIEEAGFDWIATGQSVLRNSLHEGSVDSDALHRPYRVAHSPPACFFRDDELSDLLGFVYKDWHADDAVGDLIQRLESIADADGQDRVVPIILDGENAWEHYPENAYYFFDALYSRLAEHPRLQTTTFSRALAQTPEAVGRVPRLVAGSWVYGTFSTWIGDAEKNRAWDLLVAAKKAHDARIDDLAPEQVEDAAWHLAACESSDWFWWLGHNNPETVVASFERLFRLQLTALYRSLGLDPPEELAHVFAHGQVDAVAETMRPSR